MGVLALSFGMYITLPSCTLHALIFSCVITVVDDWLARELSEAVCLCVVDMDLIVFVLTWILSGYSHTCRLLAGLEITDSILHDATVVIWGIIVPSLGIAFYI